MNIIIELPDKFEKPLETVVERIKETNPETEVDAEKILSTVCKQFITEEYSKFLMMGETA
jgi:hypothetical protein